MSNVPTVNDEGLMRDWKPDPERLKKENLYLSDVCACGGKGDGPTQGGNTCVPTIDVACLQVSEGVEGGINNYVSVARYNDIEGITTPAPVPSKILGQD